MERKVKIFDLNEVPEAVRNIWNALEDNGFDTYLVGGAVRDSFLGLSPKDFDLATSALPGQVHEVISLELPEAKLDFVGAAFGVMLVDGIEVATFRKDTVNASGEDDVEYVSSLKDDISRRDFTVNAMAITSSGILIDPFNGLVDLENRVLRFVGDANERINEDPNRILRACRFIAKLHFTPSSKTAGALWENRELVNVIAPERMRLEMLKAMECEEPSIFFGALQFLGILEFILPELSDCYQHTGGKHHPETVWEHNMLVGDALPKEDPILRLTGFLHDIGKPAAWLEAPGRFINHHKIGKKILENRLNELKFSNAEIRRICGLVDTHMFFIKGLSPKAQRKLLKTLDSYGIDWKDLVRIRIADHKGNVAKGKMTVSEVKNIVKSFTQVQDVPVSVKSLAVTGGQLIKEFGLAPGPVVSQIQKALLEYVLETGVQDEDCLLLKTQELIKK